MPIDIQWLVNILGGIAIIYFGWQKMRSDKAAGDVSVSTSWQDYVRELKEQNAAIKAENVELKGRLDDMESTIDGMTVTMEKQEKKIEQLTATIKLLEHQLRSRDIRPITEQGGQG